MYIVRRFLNVLILTKIVSILQERFFVVFGAIYALCFALTHLPFKDDQISFYWANASFDLIQKIIVFTDRAVCFWYILI